MKTRRNGVYCRSTDSPAPTKLATAQYRTTNSEMKTRRNVCRRSTDHIGNLAAFKSFFNLEVSWNATHARDREQIEYKVT
jgi:hypothetical protein